MPRSGQATLKLSRWFRAPPHRVWQAWTEEKKLMLWFGSDPQGTVSSARIDARLGGSFAVSFANSNGDAYACRGEYLRVEPDCNLEFTWGWDGSSGIRELIALGLNPTAAGTQMMFCHTYIEGSTIHDYAAGWAATFQKLAKVLRDAGDWTEW